MTPLAHQVQSPLSPLWLKAAVAGGLWASVEIIVGSFLHNIRVPFAGGVLASFGVMLMIAFYRIWPERGLIWRAGIICALMKSVSPSANILGPMISITMEAFLLDLFLRVLGKSLPASMFAGGISVMSAFGYKVFNILVVFGFNLVRVYLNLFDFAASQMGYSNANPLILIFMLAGIYFLLGMVSSVFGYVVGQRSTKLKPEEGRKLVLKQHDLFTDKENRRFSGFLLLLHVLIIPCGIILIGNLKLYYASPIALAYIIFCIIKYPAVWRKLKKPFVWMQLVVLIVLSGFFWRIADGDNGIYNTEGIFAGLQMMLRALLVISAFTGISSELQNPLIRSFLFRRGLRQVYSSVSLAFLALPAMLEESVKPRELIRRPLTAVAQMLASAGKWEKAFEQNEKNQ